MQSAHWMMSTTRNHNTMPSLCKSTSCKQCVGGCGVQWLARYYTDATRDYKHNNWLDRVSSRWILGFESGDCNTFGVKTASYIGHNFFLKWNIYMCVLFHSNNVGTLVINGAWHKRYKILLEPWHMRVGDSILSIYGACTK